MEQVNEKRIEELERKTLALTYVLSNIQEMIKKGHEICAYCSQPFDPTTGYNLVQFHTSYPCCSSDCVNKLMIRKEGTWEFYARSWVL
jgi:hypothetical protein